MSRHDAKREIEGPAELESQFILRMPEEPAKVLRELLETGASLKDRCGIRLDNDMRYGEVRVDHWLMHAKVIDLPTIIESLKTIDNKSFYKTADICQMMEQWICDTPYNEFGVQSRFPFERQWVEVGLPCQSSSDLHSINMLPSDPFRREAELKSSCDTLKGVC